MQELGSVVSAFVTLVSSGEVEIYNEFSLQHELGIFLRKRYPELRVQFERNVSFFFPGRRAFTKREIDISAFRPVGNTPVYSIELKYPRNGQHPEQMFSFCKDIAFAEELVAAGFSQAAFLAFADDQLFYRGSTDGIYGYFRGGKVLHGTIRKPTGKKDDEVTIRGHYSVEWKAVAEPLRYVLVQVESN